MNAFKEDFFDVDRVPNRTTLGGNSKEKAETSLDFLKDSRGNMMELERVLSDISEKSHDNPGITGYNFGIKSSENLPTPLRVENCLKAKNSCKKCLDRSNTSKENCTNCSSSDPKTNNLILEGIINNSILKRVFHTEKDPLNMGLFCKECRKNMSESTWYICLFCDSNVVFCAECEEKGAHEDNPTHTLLKVNNSEKTTQKTNNDDGGKSVYKCEFPKSHFKKNVAPSKQFYLEISVKNNGIKKWPPETEFRCTKGWYSNQSEGIASLSPDEKESITLRLNAPSAPGVYESFWKLGYRYNNETKTFGDLFTLELVVEAQKDFHDFSLNSSDPNRKSNTNQGRKK